MFVRSDRRTPGLIFLVFLLFFVFFAEKVYASDLIPLDYVSDLYFTAGDVNGVSQIRKGDARGRIFYIPMDLVLNSKFYLTLDEVASSDLQGVTGVNIYAVGCSSSVPSLSSFVNNVNYVYGDYSLKSVGTLDFTDLVASSFSSDYSYVAVYISASTRANYSAAFDHITVTRESISVSTPSPSSSPEVSPTVPPTLDDYTFWAYCYNRVWQSGTVAPGDIVQNFVPYNSSDMSYDGVVYVHDYTYRVKIPFRVECTGFKGLARFDATFQFDLSVDTFLSENVVPHYEFSTPWVESADSGISFNARNDDVYGFDVFGLTLEPDLTSEFYYCFDVYASFGSNVPHSNYGDFITVTLSNVYWDVLYSQVISGQLPGDILGQINQGVHDTNQTIKDQRQEEIDQGNAAADEVTSAVEDLTGNLSTLEIVTLPGTMFDDFIGAISSESSDGLTFPAFSLAGVQLWPSYTFSLSTISDNFPLLVDSLHVITGILEVLYFIRYLTYYRNRLWYAEGYHVGPGD